MTGGIFRRGVSPPQQERASVARVVSKWGLNGSAYPRPILPDGSKARGRSSKRLQIRRDNIPGHKSGAVEFMNPDVRFRGFSKRDNNRENGEEFACKKRLQAKSLDGVIVRAVLASLQQRAPSGISQTTKSMWRHVRCQGIFRIFPLYSARNGSVVRRK